MAETDVKEITSSGSDGPRCEYVREDKQPCQHPPEHEKNYCIFHLDEAKDSARFKQAFEKEVHRQGDLPILDIEGFVIPIAFNYFPHPGERIAPGMNARNAWFIGGISFAGAKFENSVDLGGAYIGGAANFNDAQFQAARFENTVFGCPSFFQETRFERANFMQARFVGAAHFAETVFNKHVIFKEARFLEKAMFIRASMHSANFFRTVFYGHADFFFTTFTELTSFNETTFLEGVSFRATEFEEALFWKPLFQGEVNFQHTKLNGIVAQTSLPWGTNFDGTDIRGTLFRSIYLGGCLFSNSVGLDECKFSQVDWFQHYPNTRWVILDELKLLHPAEFYSRLALKTRQSLNTENVPWPKMPTALGLNCVENAYRELKANYEEHGNFPDAGHFHFGEMHMRYLSKGGWLKRTLFSVEGWYRIFSGYGERARNAVVFFAVVFIFSTAMYSVKGFTINRAVPTPVQKTTSLVRTNSQTNPPRTKRTATERQRYTEVVQRQKEVFLLPSRVNLENWQYVTHTIGQSMIFSLRVALLRGDTFSETPSAWARATIVMEMILGPMSIGFLVLAVRRKVRRN